MCSRRTFQKLKSKFNCSQKYWTTHIWSHLHMQHILCALLHFKNRLHSAKDKSVSERGNSKMPFGTDREMSTKGISRLVKILQLTPVATHFSGKLTKSRTLIISSIKKITKWLVSSSKSLFSNPFLEWQPNTNQIWKKCLKFVWTLSV